MSTDHNRIKVADLEKNQRNKILTTNDSGELEFSDINNIKIDSYNALDYTVIGKALDARQGKVLKDLIDNINTVIASDNPDLNTLQELGNAIKTVQSALNTILVNDLTSGGTTKALTAEMGKALQNNKVDKMAGKNLLSDTEITRLGTLSNYTHPANHPATIITQDSTNRFVTDAEKASWNAKQSSLAFVPENAANKNVASGYAGLGTDGKLISSQLPSITLNDTFVIASQAAMLALQVQTGDLAIRTDLSKSFILKGTNPAVLADWQELLTPTSAVTTVFGRNGAITSQTGDYNADQISETANRKFQSANQQTFNDATSSIQTQLNSKASTTGSGASGTWPINVTGNANTTGGLLVHSATNNEPNKIVRTDSNGYIQAGWINTVSGDNGSNTISRIYASNDQYLRYYTPANFISTLGLATTATNRWYDGWVTAPGYDANTIAENKSGFSYSNNCPLSGQLIHFGSGGYSLQLNSNYGSGIADVRFRAHNGDNSTWGSWGRFLTDGNYNSYSPTLTGTGASGTWGINISGSSNGSARYIDLLPNRTDVAAYPILWGVNQATNPVTGNASTYAFSCDAVKIQSSTGTVIANNFSGSGSGLTGTASSLNIGGNANTSNSTTRISFSDGPRTLNDRLPNSFARTVNFDFVNAATVGGSGNYGGVMTFAPWDGLTTSTGDSSYQLAFRNESGVNGSGLPGLRLRKGIDSAWGGWYDILHSGNYNSYSAFSGAITGASLTVTGDVTAFSDARVKENIRPIKNSIKRIQASRGIVYDRIDTKQKNNIGFIAQELEKTFPELVITQEDGTKAVKYQNAVAVLFEAIKEQQTQIEKQLLINEKQSEQIKIILQKLNLQ
ncbi:tail fiber domain-containing protein [Flavobacterium sp.]|uniref:tail fiber domain-containing protein n=1 Tax=Flavobacterium sp. TaxID=239 RepID=UPI003D14BCA3